jgi:hypothetical protein
MGNIRPIPQSHPFVAIMFTDARQQESLLARLQEKFGVLLGQGPIYRVRDFTDYYEIELGPELQKQFLVFRERQSLEKLYQSKRWSNELEVELFADPDRPAQRKVNIDPGYLEPSKLVLFSTKDFSHRIYLGESIYAEVTMLFLHGRFKILPWTYPDYAWENNLKFLMQMRREVVLLARSRSSDERERSHG